MRNMRALTDSHDWTEEQAAERTLVPFPLDFKWHPASHWQAWLSTRTKGIFSADSEFLLTPTGGMTMQLSPGRAWLNCDLIDGLVLRSKEPIDIQLDIAHPLHTQIYRTVLRYDVIVNDFFPALLIGIPSSDPQPPELERSATAYEMLLQDVAIPPGTLEITPDMITDWRLDEDMCGIMRDGVTGIPTQALHDNFNSWLETTRGEFVTWSDQQKADFIAWVDTIKDILDEEVAGNLLLMIQKLEGEVEELEKKLDESINRCPHGIGDILQTVNPKPPHERWPGTEWEPWAEERAVVGVGAGIFAGVETEIGTLDHFHSQAVHAHGMGAHTHVLNDSGHARILIGTQSPRGILGQSVAASAWTNTRQAEADAVSFSQTNNNGTPLRGNTGAMSSANTLMSAAVNTGSASNVQPSITCYMWKRVA